MPETRRGEKGLPELSKAEWEVMKTLWDKGPMAARDVYAAIPPGHGWAYKTVKTLLARLVTKKALEYEQVGNSYLYKAACSRERVAKQEMKGFLDRVFDGSLAPVLAHFAEGGRLSNDDIAELRNILDKHEGQARIKKSGSKEKK